MDSTRKITSGNLHGQIYLPSQNREFSSNIPVKIVTTLAVGDAGVLMKTCHVTSTVHVRESAQSFNKQCFSMLKLNFILCDTCTAIMFISCC